MPRYIDAESFRTWILKQHRLSKNYTVQMLDETPTADVQEVKHAHWSCVNEDECNYMCDGDEGCGRVLSLVLGSPEDYDIGYCPFCGAKMDEKEEHE